MMNEEKISAIVMRYANYKDYHRMLNLFSAKHGIISVLSPACRRIKSPLRAASEMFIFGDFAIKTRNGRQTLVSADIIDSFYDIRLDLGALSCSVYMRDFCEAVLIAGDADIEVFSLLIRCLTSLCHDKIDPQLIRYAFEINMMEHLGLAISLERCIKCDGGLNKEIYIDIENGGALCSKCIEGVNENQIKTKAGAVNTLKQIKDMPFEKLFVIKLTKDMIDSIEVFWSKYISWHLERRFKSGEFLKKRLEEANTAPI